MNAAARPRAASPRLPSYAELRVRTDAPRGSSWGLFGPDDERGMANLAGASEVAAAASGVQRGVTFDLDHAIDAFTPPVARHRSSYAHHVTSTHADQRDDYVDGFWLQTSSQLDGLRHRRHTEHGFYNGVSDGAITAGSPTLGVQRWAQVPLVGRGVLVDVAGLRARRGEPIRHEIGERLPIGLLDEALDAQGDELRRGDCLLLRTGWATWYLGLPGKRQAEVRDSRRWTGLEATEETIAWLWDHGLSLAASDTMALEALPASGDTRFGGPHEPGMIHQDLIALLGLPIGELWNLEALAADSDDHGDHTCLLVCKPLHLTGAVGSPANAVAIR